MELEDIKILMRYQVKNPEGKQIQDISLLLRNKPSGTIARLSGSIRIEMITSIIFLAIVLALPLLIPVAFIQFVAAGTILYIIFFLRFLFILHQQIRQFGKEIMSTHQSIQTIIRIMERFSRLYLQFCMLFIPVLFILSLAFFLADHPLYLDHPLDLLNLKAFRLFVAGFITWSIFMYFFSGWYIKKMYKQPLSMLKKELKELEAI